MESGNINNKECPAVCATSDFLFDIGDVVCMKDDENGVPRYLGSFDSSGKSYKDNLSVAFRFFDGAGNVYVLDTGDGDRTVSLVAVEEELSLQRKAETAGDDVIFSVPVVPGIERKSIPADLYDELDRLGIIPNDVRSSNVGKSDYSEHTIQSWSIWIDYNLNPWDADIVKRVLRRKEGESRRMDYEKIIHVSQERIRQIDCEENGY